MMAVCRLAVEAFATGDDNGGYDAADLRDCIGMARANLAVGYDHVAYVPVDIPGFIRWCEDKLAVRPITGSEARK